MTDAEYFADGTLSWAFVPRRMNVRDDGCLEVIEAGLEVNFEIKRSFIVSGVPGDGRRGAHSHKELQQLVTCLSGEYDFFVDNGIVSRTFRMTANSEHLFLDGRVWREMSNFSGDALMLVHCDRQYIYDDVVQQRQLFYDALPTSGV
jgi:hypothetical protein